MVFDPLSESAWARGWRNTKSVWTSWQFVTVDVIGGILLGSLIKWYWGLPIIVFGMLCSWLGATLRAPVVQRNEARRSLHTQANYEDMIADFASMLKKADGLGIIWLQERGVTEAVLHEAIDWTKKAVNDISLMLGTVHNKQVRTKAELPLQGELNDGHFKVPYARIKHGSELALIRERHYAVYNWLKDFIETAPPTHRKGDSQS